MFYSLILVTLDCKEFFLSLYLLFFRHYMRMHSPCLICVNNGWLSTCNLLLEKITAKRIWFWAKWNFCQLSNQWGFSSHCLGKVDCNEVTWRRHLLEIDNPLRHWKRGGLPYWFLCLSPFWFCCPFICYVALVRLLLNCHRFEPLGWPHFMGNML